jgi:hypothetical protein
MYYLRHIITLTHVKDGVQQFECRCGENGIGPEKLVKGLIYSHRAEISYLFRWRMLGGI